MYADSLLKYLLCSKTTATSPFYTDINLFFFVFMNVYFIFNSLINKQKVFDSGGKKRLCNVKFTSVEYLPPLFS